MAQAVQLLASGPPGDHASAAAPASGSDGSQRSSSTSFNSPAALASGSSSASPAAGDAPRSLRGSDDEAPPLASALRSNVLSNDDFPQCKYSSPLSSPPSN